MSLVVAQIVALLCAPTDEAGLMAKREAQGFGSVVPSGKGWKWELHRDGLPGVIRERAISSPTYTSPTAAWIGLLDVVHNALRGLKEVA